MKTSMSREHPHHTPVMVRRADAPLERAVAVVVPDSGADVEAVERALIEFALERTGGNRTHAARFLGLSRSALIYRMHKHGLVRNVGDAEPVRAEGGSHQ
ncbi:MAG: helix-turn-helix domain-containing protein [Acidobacteria bacterium]|nr:helix-turn-helix domain-containing protein [Acidobacteriota bacterium]